jgi:hypothetical protein
VTLFFFSFCLPVEYFIITVSRAAGSGRFDSSHACYSPSGAGARWSGSRRGGSGVGEPPRYSGAAPPQRPRAARTWTSPSRPIRSPPAGGRPRSACPYGAGCRCRLRLGVATVPPYVSCSIYLFALLLLLVSLRMVLSFTFTLFFFFFHARERDGRTDGLGYSKQALGNLERIHERRYIVDSSCS